MKVSLFKEIETVILTTAATIEGKKIVDHYGIVSSETILGANIFKDFLAGMRDMVGGRSASYEKALREAKEIALKELTDQAKTLGANAVIAIALDYETINGGSGSSMLMVAVSGTAVRYQELQTV
nr:heavy metal-binding domain-containing protein [Pseudanabaena sp. FACHB-2040]